ncbi:MAG: hypothetical protein H0U85_03115 [Gemmatimonadales bacterium]|nr:hypothetical protein [Gemmatimonadales bacterium]
MSRFSGWGKKDEGLHLDRADVSMARGMVGASGCELTLTHRPTGITVVGRTSRAEPSERQLRWRLMKELDALVPRA